MLILVTRGGVAVGTYNPSTGAYTPAIRSAPQGQPVGTSKPIERSWWRDQ